MKLKFIDLNNPIKRKEGININIWQSYVCPHQPEPY